MIDPRALRPGEITRLLNSSSLGPVIVERQLHRHRTRAGFRIATEGQASRIDLVRYVGWMIGERHAYLAREAGDAEAKLSGYEAHKERARQRNAALSASGRDIGEIPDVVDPKRLEESRLDFERYCRVYFARTFGLPFSRDHRRIIAKIEEAVLEGGLFAMAMPRGTGKSSLCECAGTWSLNYGHRPFVALIGPDEDLAEGMLSSIKSEYENNELLLADFPSICFPIRALEGIHQRVNGQLYRGKQTQMSWTGDEIVLPTIPGSIASGSIVRVAGITGAIRGMKHKRADGSTIRPSLVIVDDPQTDESARSVTQCAARERILAGAVLGLAGPGTKIAGLVTCTVIRADDLADRLLDREKHPQWQGERTKMVYAFPTNEKLWAEYAKRRAEGLRGGRGLADATAFYASNREAMDDGAEVSWPERFNHDEISAIQHAMNLRLQDEPAFFAECQNEPLPETPPDPELLSADQISGKTNGHARSLVPAGCSHLTMFVDVQAKVLFYTVVGWSDDFTGYVIEYGTEPDQRAARFTARDARRTLQDLARQAGIEGQIFAGLERLATATLGREWRQDGGGVLRIERCLVDANWGGSTDIVYQFARQSTYSAVITPSHGRYVGASSVPLADYRAVRGDRAGLNWRIPALAGKRPVRHAIFDTNFWKSFVHARLAVAMGDPGSLSVHDPARAGDHDLFAEHLTAEYRVKTEGRGRTVDEWKLRAEGQENHWLDCIVGAAVAASISGCALPGMPSSKGLRQKQRYRLSDLRNRALAYRR